jgi:hypothetical protein
MPLFSNTVTKRRTVHMVLLAWLFAMVAGWANACLLQQRVTHGHVPSDSGSLTAQLPQVSPGHIGVDAVHAENAGPGKSACLKVCDDDSRAIIKLAPSADLADMAMTPPVALAWLAPLATVEWRNSWLTLPAPGPVVPLRTRFARLTL